MGIKYNQNGIKYNQNGIKYNQNGIKYNQNGIKYNQNNFYIPFLLLTFAPHKRTIILEKPILCMSSFFKSLNNYFFMKKLNNEQMENLQGGLQPFNWCKIGANMCAASMFGGEIVNEQAYMVGMNLQLNHC